MSANFEYKVKLIGILPQGIAFGPEKERWNTQDLQVVEIPSKLKGITGVIEREGHPNLEGTAIIEKISHMKPKSRLEQYSESSSDASSIEESEDEDRQNESSWVTESEETGNSSDSASVNETKRDSNQSVVALPSEAALTKINVASNFKLGILDEWNRGSLRMRWLKNNFAPETEELPQITCSRRILNQLITHRDRFYTIKARKTCFKSRGGLNQEKFLVIEIYSGLSFHDLKEANEVKQGKKELRDYFPRRLSSSDPAIVVDKCTAYYSAVLIRHGFGVRSQKINILLDTSIDGVWIKRKDPKLYESKDIAEIRHVDATSINPPPWIGFCHHYKQSILAGHWAQSMLIGANRYISNIYGDQNEDYFSGEKKLKEKWLYDVENMPEEVAHAARKDGFKPWHRKEMLGRLYNGLQYIRNYMARRGMAEEEVIHFVHYEHEDHLLPLNSEDMDDELNCLREAKKTVVIKNVNFDSPDLVVAEANARSLIDSLMSREPDTDRWPKPQLLMFPDERMLQLKFKYLQHATAFIRITKKFMRTNSSSVFRSIKASPNITERLQNLKNMTAGYDDHNADEATDPRISQWRGQTVFNPRFFSYPVPPSPNNGKPGAFLFPSISNATADQNWRIAINATNQNNN